MDSRGRSHKGPPGDTVGGLPNSGGVDQRSRHHLVTVPSMTLKRALILLGLLCLVWGTWIGFPLSRAVITGALIPGRLIDVRTTPAGEGQLRVSVVFEYAAPNENRTLLQGFHQVDERLRAIEDPILPAAEALALRQHLLDRPRRRVFLAATDQPSIMADAASYGTALRQGLPLLLGGGLLLISLGLRLGRRPEY